MKMLKDKDNSYFGFFAALLAVVSGGALLLLMREPLAFQTIAGFGLGISVGTVIRDKWAMQRGEDG